MQSAVVQPKEIGQDGPTMAAMNTNMLFGISTFGLCEVLENIAPNVNELQLFNDDAAEVCMGRECLSMLFYVALCHRPSLPVTRSLFAPLVPWARWC